MTELDMLLSPVYHTRLDMLAMSPACTMNLTNAILCSAHMMMVTHSGACAYSTTCSCFRGGFSTFIQARICLHLHSTTGACCYAATSQSLQLALKFACCIRWSVRKALQFACCTWLSVCEVWYKCVHTQWHQSLWLSSWLSSAALAGTLWFCCRSASRYSRHHCELPSWFPLWGDPASHLRDQPRDACSRGKFLDTLTSCLSRQSVVFDTPTSTYHATRFAIGDRCLVHLALC